MPVATLDPRTDTLVVPTEGPVLVVCLSDDDEIETLRTAVASVR